MPCKFTPLPSASPPNKTTGVETLIRVVTLHGYKHGNDLCPFGEFLDQMTGTDFFNDLGSTPITPHKWVKCSKDRFCRDQECEHESQKVALQG